MNETAKRKIICVSGRDKDKIIEASSMLLGYCMGCGFATGLLAPDEYILDDRQDDPDEAPDEALGEDCFEETATDPTVWKKILKTAETMSSHYEVLIFAGCFSSAAISRLRKAIPDMMHLAIVSEEPQEILPWQLGILDPQQDMDLCDGIIRASGDSKELWHHVSLFGEYVIAECNLDSFIHSIY